jgi:hypothetical protein
MELPDYITFTGMISWLLDKRISVVIALTLENKKTSGILTPGTTLIRNKAIWVTEAKFGKHASVASVEYTVDLELQSNLTALDDYLRPTLDEIEPFNKDSVLDQPQMITSGECASKLKANMWTADMVKSRWKYGVVHQYRDCTVIQFWESDKFQKDYNLVWLTNSAK